MRWTHLFHCDIKNIMETHHRYIKCHLERIIQQQVRFLSKPMSWSHLVTEVHARGWVSYLGDVEELEEILHLDGHGAGSWSNQADDGLLPLHQQAPGLYCAPGLALLLLVRHQRIPDELNALLKRHRRVPARVPVVENLGSYFVQASGIRRRGGGEKKPVGCVLVCVSCFWEDHFVRQHFWSCGKSAS